MAKLKIYKHAELIRAFEKGKLAKQKGFMRISPFYEEKTLDEYFFRGYDGFKFDEIKIKD